MSWAPAAGGARSAHLGYSASASRQSISITILPCEAAGVERFSTCSGQRTNMLEKKEYEPNLPGSQSSHTLSFKKWTSARMLGEFRNFSRAQTDSTDQNLGRILIQAATPALPDRPAPISVRWVAPVRVATLPQRLTRWEAQGSVHMSTLRDRLSRCKVCWSFYMRWHVP